MRIFWLTYKPVWVFRDIFVPFSQFILHDNRPKGHLPVSTRHRRRRAVAEKSILESMVAVLSSVFCVLSSVCTLARASPD